MTRHGRPELEPVEIACLSKLRETDKAALYRLADGADVWIPKSVIEDEDEMDDGAIVLSVAGWFAEKEGLGDE